MDNTSEWNRLDEIRARHLKRKEREERYREWVEMGKAKETNKESEREGQGDE